MKAIFLVLIALFMAKGASALSVASDFLENDTMVLEEDSHRLYGIRLQNGKSQDAHISVTYDQEFATILNYQQVYVVPPKSSLSITFNISGEKIKPGQTKTISYTIHELSGSGEGVPILLKINKNFKVTVPARQRRTINNDYLAYGFIVLAVVLYAVFSKTRQSKKKRK